MRYRAPSDKKKDSQGWGLDIFFSKNPMQANQSIIVTMPENRMRY